jgi:hypothetical protein
MIQRDGSHYEVQVALGLVVHNNAYRQRELQDA